ncbi:hypothetical protein EDB83DRAFT_2519197 [Lactarius deliciosus]|nr:hypothetical protein EDB83DRAFT_2519197 [Lactarius deliciosus]
MPPRYYHLPVIFVLATGLVGGLAMPSHDFRVKRRRSSYGVESRRLGDPGPSTETTTDLYLVLNPQHENALIDALHKIEPIPIQGAPHLDHYLHVEMNETVLRTLSYSLPDTFPGYKPSRRRHTSTLYALSRRTRAFCPVG